MKKILSLLLATLIAVTSFGFVSTAYADDTIDGSVSETGTGTINAQGDGIALLYGRGIVQLKGNGMLWIKDMAGDATIRVTGTGHKKEFPDGWIQYAGFRGKASIKGSKIGVIVAGVDIDLRARGRGRVILWGHGTYEVNGSTGRWKSTGFGETVKLAPVDAS